MMAREELCVLTNMCMIQDGNKILVQDRMDPEWPGITFPGGHVEPKESFVDSVIREVKEETGLDITDVRLCGIKQWTQQDGKYRYIVLFFKTDKFTGTLQSSSECRVFWIDRNEIKNFILADGFETMYDVFLSDELSENYHWFDGIAWNQENK